MTPIDMSGIPDKAIPAFRPFAEELVARYAERLASISVTGSCLTGDFIPGISDINSMIEFTRTDLPELEILASMGRKYRRKGIKSPLIMTGDYIRRSLDVFPVEFLDMKLFHRTVYGEDPLHGLVIEKAPLRMQCERDLKGKLINLQRGFIACEGGHKEVRALLMEAFPGFFPLLRALLYIVHIPKEPPAHKADVLTEAESVLNIPLGGLRDVLTLKTGGKIPHDRAAITLLFKEILRITHDLCLAVDALSV